MDILSEQGATYDECLARIRENRAGCSCSPAEKVKIGGFLGFFEKDGIELYFMLSKIPTARRLHRILPRQISMTSGSVSSSRR